MNPIDPKLACDASNEVYDIPILHLTKAIAVVLKPQGIHSQPAPDGKPDLTEILQKQLGGEIYVVHRLDRDTEGVMVYARSKQAAASLSKSIQSGRMEKEYHAIVHGICPERGEMTDLLFHRQSGNKTFVVDRMRAGVKEARLTFERLGTVSEPEPLSLVRIALQTGRTHQIRVQFAHRGYPLYGDGKYGAHSPGKTALFCTKITFPDPLTSSPLTFAAPPRSLPLPLRSQFSPLFASPSTPSEKTSKNPEK